MAALDGVQLPVLVEVNVTGTMAKLLLEDFINPDVTTSVEDMGTAAKKIVDMLSMDSDVCRHPGSWDKADPEFAAIILESFDALEQSADVLPGQAAPSADDAADAKVRSTATEHNIAVKAGVVKL